MRQLSPLVIALCAATPSSLRAFGQAVSPGSLTGHVVDSSNAVIVRAHVQLKGRDSAATADAMTDPSGYFAFTALPPGSYQLRVQHGGFREQAQTVLLTGGRTAAIVVTLSASAVAQTVTVQAQSPLITESPTGQTQQEVSREDFKNTPATTVAQVLDLVPGVTFVQGNGPRDVSISVRGSNERQTYGVRNVQVFEDGFAVTQPDGLARTDLTDPHAYSSVDVVQGPSSSLYGNYATGGAINFHTRSGSEIQGLEIGSDFGSFGYFNDYATYGVGNEHFQVSAFLSNVRATQATSNNQFNTITGNILATFAVTPHDRFTFKFLNNDLDTKLSLRLSLAQYRLNPYQAGCETYTAIAAARGCASVSLFANGYNGTRESLTAAQAGLGRHDRRTIVGARYEHDLTENTTWRTQFVFDDRDINQPTGSTSYRGPYPSFNVVSDVLRRSKLGTKPAMTYAGGFFNYENISSFVSNVVPGGSAALGGQVQTVFGKHLNTGGRARQELTLGEHWTLVAGLGMEFTGLQALANNFSYPPGGTPVSSPVAADRTFFNVAPEVSVQYHPQEALRLHARLGTGYGTPQATQLFTNAQGAFGNNITLKTQRNVGIDTGADWTPNTYLHASLTGFYEWFHNEQVTQSAGVNLQSFTFNAPASAHRGVEAGVDLHPMPQALAGLRLRASYLYDNQIYRKYTEQLTTGAISASFVRNGNRIPGVQPNYLNGRVIYEQPSGALRGIGGFVEVNWRDNYLIDNANLLSAPGYVLLNVSTHYDPPAGHGVLSRLRFYFDIENLANKTYVASASNLTNSLASNGQQNGAAVLTASTGSVYAGTPRASYGGVRVRF